MHPGGKTSILVVSQVDWFISLKIEDLGQWVFSGCGGGGGGGGERVDRIGWRCKCTLEARRWMVVSQVDWFISLKIEDLGQWVFSGCGGGGGGGGGGERVDGIGWRCKCTLEARRWMVVSQVDWFISLKIEDLGQWVFSGCGGWRGGGERVDGIGWRCKCTLEARRWMVVSQVDWFISLKIEDLGQWVFSGYGGGGGGESGWDRLKM